MFGARYYREPIKYTDFPSWKGLSIKYNNKNI